MTLEEKLDLAASKIGLREPFIAAVISRLPRTLVDSPDMTAMTNGTWFKFGTQFCDPLGEEELLGLYLHEALHVVLMHMWRRDGREPALWNIANDAIINRFLLNKGYRIPSGGVVIDWVQEDADSETVYEKLRKMQQDADGQGQGKGKGKSSKSGPMDQHGQGGFNGKGDLEDAPDEAQKADIEATIIAAAQMARDCGDKSSLVDRILGAELQPIVNWRDELRAVMTSAARDDFSYRRFSKRFIGRGLYLPSLWSEAMGGLVVGFDTSGSMNEDDCNRVAAEIQGIVDDTSPDWVEVVYCDTNVKSTERFQKGETLRLHPKGGGGTRFKPVFDYVEKLGERIAALVYLTDMEGPMGELQEPLYPVLWGNITGRHEDAPFGKVIKVIL